jgi:hypothetical protein
VRFRTQTINEDVPWLGHERDDVALTRDGSVFVLFELQGIGFETPEDWLISERKQRLNHTFCQIPHETFTPSSGNTVETAPSRPPRKSRKSTSAL